MTNPLRLLTWTLKNSTHKNKHRSRANQNIFLEKWEGDLLKEVDGWHVVVGKSALLRQNPKCIPALHYGAATPRENTCPCQHSG